MITEKDLQEAIAECEGQRDPNANTCIKLAAFYTIKQHMFGEVPNSYSYSAGENIVDPPVVQYESDTQFGKMVGGMDYNDLLPIVDELATTLSVVNPRLYSSFMRKLESRLYDSH